MQHSGWWLPANGSLQEALTAQNFCTAAMSELQASHAQHGVIWVHIHTGQAQVKVVAHVHNAASPQVNKPAKTSTILQKGDPSQELLRQPHQALLTVWNLGTLWWQSKGQRWCRHGKKVLSCRHTVAAPPAGRWD